MLFSKKQPSPFAAARAGVPSVAATGPVPDMSLPLAQAPERVRPLGMVAPIEAPTMDRSRSKAFSEGNWRVASCAPTDVPPNSLLNLSRPETRSSLATDTATLIGPRDGES